MPRFLALVPIEEAVRRIFQYWTPKVKFQRVSLENALGRVAAQKVSAPIDIPPFDRAQYDGYAVRARDTFGADEGFPKKLWIIGEARAGAVFRRKVGPRECVRIGTGAPLPPGANAIVMVEHTREVEGGVEILKSVSPGENVIKKGSDVRQGEVLVEKNHVFGPRETGALAAAGVSTVVVYAEPRVGIISTGDELQTPGTRLKEGKVFDVNSYTLFAAVKNLGGYPRLYGHVSDKRDEISKIVERALKENDIVLLSGGTSAGEGDLVPEILNSMGKPGVIVHGITQKPGKPTLIAVLKRKLVIGLPGYPVSALMVFNELVAPLIRTMTGRGKESNKVRARLTTKYLSVRGRREMVPVQLKTTSDGVYARPMAKDSGAIASLAKVDGYFVIPVNKEIVVEGEEVEVELFGF